MTRSTPWYTTRTAVRRLRYGAAAAVLAAASMAAVTGTAGAEDGGREENLIVELAGAPAAQQVAGPGDDVSATAKAAVAQRRGVLRAGQRDLLARARSSGVRLTERRSFSLVFNGVAVRARQEDKAALSRLPGVVGVYQDRTMTRYDTASNEVIGAPEMWERSAPGGTKAQGDGVTVAVIDTGVDHGHPDLGAGFGAGHKVAGGYDFVNGDGDPMDDHGHGTHVAGIIAGDGGVRGVAPKATLTAYKVLDAAGSGYESDIIAGIEAAADPAGAHRADVINLSLGGSGDGTEPIGRAATRAVESGVVVVAAAGNSGPGTQTVGSPASADGVIAVGATTAGVRVPRLSVTRPEQRKLQAFRNAMSAVAPSRPANAKLVDGGTGTPEELAGLGSLTGRIVLIAGEPPSGMEAVVHDIERRGALAVVIGRDGDFGPMSKTAPRGTGEDRFATAADTRLDRLVVLNVDEYETDHLRGLLAKGAVTLRLESADTTDTLANFSSRGPSARLGAKPDLVAPGVEVLSTVPGKGTERMSGTSMASPHVAGAAALLRQLAPGRPVAAIGGALVGGAKPLPGLDASEQGAGRLDIPAAADAGLFASPPSLSPGLAGTGGKTVRGTGTVHLTNPTSKKITTRLRATGSGVTISPRTVSLKAGGSVDVQVTVTGATPDGDGDLTGWIESEGGDRIRVPYLLAARHLRLYATPDPSDGTSQAFVYSPAPLAAPPILTVTGPGGSTTEVKAEFDHGAWYRAPLRGDREGAYEISARASAIAAWGGAALTGTGAFEVTPADARGARWEPIGPNSGSGRFSTTPAAPGQLGVAQYGDAGVWMTTDRGRTWQQRRRLPVGPIASGEGWLVTDPRDGRRMWHGLTSATAVGPVDPTYQGKILRTEDGGRTWTTLTFPDVAIDGLAADSSGTHLVALAGGVVHVSHDRGDTWQARTAPWTKTPTGLVITGSDLFVSTYEGVWKVPGITGTTPGEARRVLDERAALVHADGTMVVAAGAGEIVRGSRDGGATWKDLYTLPNFPQVLEVVDGDIYVGTTSDEHVGRDHGATWTRWRTPHEGAIEVDFATWPDGEVLFSTGGAGVYSTRDGGGSYSRIGIQGATVFDLAMTRDAAGGPVLVAGTDYDVYRTPLPTGAVTPRTREWGTAMEGGFGYGVERLSVSPRDPREIWKTVARPAIDQFAVMRSEDGGATWTEMAVTYQNAGDLIVHPADPDRIIVGYSALGDSGLFTSANGGKTWRKFQHGQTFTAIAGDPRDADRLWLGNEKGLWRSDDGDHTIEKVSGDPVSVLTVDRDGRRIVAGGASIKVSEDGGRTFGTADTGGLPMSVTAIVTSPSEPRTLYAGTGAHRAAGLLKGGRGVLRSTDGGRTWGNISGDLQNTAVNSLAISPDGRWLYAGTRHGGVHRLSL